MYHCFGVNCAGPASQEVVSLIARGFFFSGEKLCVYKCVHCYHCILKAIKFSFSGIEALTDYMSEEEEHADPVVESAVKNIRPRSIPNFDCTGDATSFGTHWNKWIRFGNYLF